MNAGLEARGPEERGPSLETTGCVRLPPNRGDSPMNDMTMAQRADALEDKMARELDYIVVKSRLHALADGDMNVSLSGAALQKANPGAHFLMGDDPRLPAMPEKPTLIDFFKLRFGPS